jgi:hypothetical protein
MYDILCFFSLYILLGTIIAICFCKLNRYGNQLLHVFLLALCFRMLMTLFYYYFSLTSWCDAQAYYVYATKNAFSIKHLLIPGTDEINNLTALVYPVASLFDNKYLMLFIPFSLLGFLGSLIFFKLIKTYYGGIKKYQIEGYFVSLFLPNVIFWTSNLGKDSIFYFGFILLIYGFLSSSLRLKTVLFIVSGFIIIYFIRPHIFLFIVISLFIGLIFEQGTFSFRRIAVFLIIFMCYLLTQDKIFKFVGIKIEKESDSKSLVASYLEGSTGSLESKAQALNSGGAATGMSAKVNIVYTPFYIINFLGSPFLWQSKKTIQLLSAVENLIYQIIILYILFNMKILLKLKSIRYKYCWGLYIIISSITLGMAYTNFGLTVRQKCMVLPLIILFFTSIRSFKYNSNQKYPYKKEITPSSIINV